MKSVRSTLASVVMLLVTIGFGSSLLHAQQAPSMPAAATVDGGLKDTVVSLTPQQQKRFIQGYSADYRPAHSWDLDGLAGAGAIRSTADDMLTYLEAQIHPEKLAAKGGKGAAGTLPKAVALSHEVRDQSMPGMHIAFAWLVQDASGGYWHNGATGGYSSFAFFSPKDDYAAIILVNRTVGPQGNFADLLGTHISQRLTGKPAISLGD